MDFASLEANSVFSFLEPYNDINVFTFDELSFLKQLQKKGEVLDSETYDVNRMNNRLSYALPPKEASHGIWLCLRSNFGCCTAQRIKTTRSDWWQFTTSIPSNLQMTNIIHADKGRVEVRYRKVYNVVAALWRSTYDRWSRRSTRGRDVDQSPAHLTATPNLGTAQLA